MSEGMFPTPSIARSVVQVQRRALTGKAFLFMLAHLPLAILIDRVPVLATAHALGTLLVGVWFALTRKSPRLVAFTAAYIAGAEVLWRMAGAQVFWEFGKYAIILPLLIYSLRWGRWKNAGLPILFFALLVPSILLTVLGLDLSRGREEISFNLSGPLSLAVSAVFFLRHSLTWEDRKKVALFMATPIIGIAAVVLFGIQSASELAFNSASNFATSGGFGPNQVSAVLSLGAMLLLILAILETRRRYRWLVIFLGLGLLVFSVLTFSRGGLYNFTASLLLAAVFFVRRQGTRNSLLLVLAVAMIAGSFWIYPWLNSFTGGMLQTRYSSLDTTNRAELASAEVKIWFDNPILGVGPGMAKYERFKNSGVYSAAHTEYTRLLAEHGILGACAIFLLFAMAYQAILRAPGPAAQAWTVALLAWSLLEMTHAAMRVGAIGFVFGLALCSWLPVIKNRIRSH